MDQPRLARKGVREDSFGDGGVGIEKRGRVGWRGAVISREMDEWKSQHRPEVGN